MSLDQIIADKRKRMKEIEAEYLRAREYVNSGKQDGDFVRALKKIMKLVGHKGLLSDEAIYTIGRIQQIFADLAEPDTIISEYESLKKSVEEAAGK